MLDDKVSLIKGIGEKTETYLNEQGIHTMYDLVMTLPKRYLHYNIENPNNITDSRLVCIKGKFTKMISIKKVKNNLSTIIFQIESESLVINCIVFGQEFLRYRLKSNVEAIFYGIYKPNSKELVIREVFFDIFNEKIIPIYPIKNITSNSICKYIDNIYKANDIDFFDDLPNFLKEKYLLLNKNDYIYKCHFPTTSDDLRQIRRRTKYEDYLKYCISMYYIKYYINTTKKEVKEFDINIIDCAINSLDYKLTTSQISCLNEIFSDLKSDKLMNRLIQGDVGCGKSIVSYFAAYASVLAGYQVALMVPSEVLSNQHYENIKKIFNNYNIRTKLLNSKFSKKEKEMIIKELKNGYIDILVGTQSLIEDDVVFNKLGLIIIDEQHKFGVKERNKLLNKGDLVDALFLSATPIPRTLMLSRFGEVNLSSINMKPNGRKDVLTKVLDINETDFVYRAIMKNVNKGHQVFVVVPQINESDEGDITNVNDKYDELRKNLDCRVSFLHGQLSEKNKLAIFEKFKEGLIDVLVSTTVIEVGIDISNATLMVIYNAERFGLSTLHQLRGRVGRSDLISGCLLLTNNTLTKRLKILEECYDCFKLSEYDLELRGPGDILGCEQSGFLTNSLENDNDIKILECAKDDASLLYDAYLKGNNYKIVSDVFSEMEFKKNILN